MTADQVGPKPPRWRRLAGEVFRFGLVGLVNTAVTQLVYMGLNRLMPYPVALAIGFAIGLVVSFFLNCTFTWRVRPTWRRFFLFPWPTAVNFAITMLVTALLVQGAHWGKDLAGLAAMVVAVPVTFLLTRLVLTGSHNDPRSRVAGPTGSKATDESGEVPLGHVGRRAPSDRP